MIIDAGIATQDNIKLLREEGFSYWVNETRNSRNKYQNYFDEKELFTPVKKGDKELTVKIRHLDFYDGEVESEEIQAQSTSGSSQADDKTQPFKERLVLCRNTPRKAKEEAIYSGAERKFLEGLEKLWLCCKKLFVKLRCTLS